MSVRARMRPALLAGAALAGACADDPGPLAISTVADVARTPGDAEGYARSGTYDAQLTGGDCDCPAVTIPSPVATGPCLLQFALLDTISFGAVQSDGLLVFELPPFELVGGLDIDGTFALGSVDELSNVVGSGHHIARIDGEFDPSGDFSAELVHRYDAKIGDQSLKCSEHITVDGRRR